MDCAVKPKCNESRQIKKNFDQLKPEEGTNK